MMSYLSIVEKFKILFDMILDVKFIFIFLGVLVIATFLYLIKKIDNRKYIVSLFFRNGKIYMVSLICCDKEFSEKDEDKRKILHDDILNELGIDHQMEYSWGKISSDYDARSNVSSIDIMYFN